MYIRNQKHEPKTEHFVSTGYLYTGNNKGLITSSPLGSCIALVAYDSSTKIGGLAHIMLPGKSPKGDDNKYAENAIANLLKELKDRGAAKVNIETCLIGGANVLKNKNDTIGDLLIVSIFNNLKKERVVVAGTSLGGYERRTATLDLDLGVVHYTVGDGLRNRLHQFTTNK